MRPKWKSPGDKENKLSNKLSDDDSVVSSRSCISTASNVAKFWKLRIPIKNPTYDESFTNRPDIQYIAKISSNDQIAMQSLKTKCTTSSAIIAHNVFK